MGPHDSGSSSSSAGRPSSDVDGLLAGAGYKVRSSDLRQVAHRLERLETAMVNAPPDEISLLSSDSVHHNPSDLASWLDSMLSDLHPPPLPTSDLPYVVELDQEDRVDGWMIQHDNTPQRQHHLEAALDEFHQPQSLLGVATFTAMDEDSGIKLVYMLMTCAESVQRGDLPLARSLLRQMQTLLARVNPTCGIGNVAGYFIDALSCRIFSPVEIGVAGGSGASALENEIMYHSFYEACPYLKFAHFTANQAILEAFGGCDCVHVVDFNLMQGLQWPPLIQALALRRGGPPLLRITGIGPPSPDGRDSIREIGLRLAKMARSVNVRFAFRGIAAARLQDVKPWMLQLSHKEVVAVNSIMQLHRLLGPDESTRNDSQPPIDAVLGWIRSLNPKIVTVVEQEADHNRPEFLDRFTKALHYYSTVFDSLAAACAPMQREKAVAEMYIQGEIRNVLCCEGAARVERHEPLAKWRARLIRSGLKPLHVGSNAFKLASVLLTQSSAEGYCVEENDGCLTLCWHSRPLIAASAWQPAPDAAALGS